MSGVPHTRMLQEFLVQLPVLVINIYVLYLCICVWLYCPLSGPSRFFSFLLYTQSVGLLGWGISPSQGRYLHTEQHKHRINTQISILRVGFEPTIPVFERAKAVHILDRAAGRCGRLYVL
jgi:hypothetical protein